MSVGIVTQDWIVALNKRPCCEEVTPEGSLELDRPEQQFHYPGKGFGNPSASDWLPASRIASAVSHGKR